VFGYLSYLDLSHNSIGGSLPSSLDTLLPALDTLLLSNKCLQGSVPAVVFSIANWSSSVEVDLSNNHLDGVVGSDSCDALGGGMGAVDLSGNALGCYASCWDSLVGTDKVAMGSNAEPCMPSESPTQAPTAAPTPAG
jgi:hypothetical protein